MCGGGGGGGPDPWGPGGSFYEANVKRHKDEVDAANEKSRADAAIAQAAQDKTNARNTFTTGLSSAEASGRNTAAQYLASRGLPADQGAIDRVVQSIKDQIPDLDPNPQKYFTNDAFASKFDTEAQGTRDRLTNQVNSTFTPGFEKTLIGDTADDPFIESILGEQRGTAQKVVDFNKARGLLNDTGYSSAQSALDTQGTAARSTLGQIGESILGKYRQDLSNIRGEAGSAASGYQYGQTAPDIGSYWGRATSKAGEDLAGIEGSIRGAVGGTNYFDAPTALQKGGTMQGPIDLTTQPGAGAPGTMVASNKKDQGRGLGSSGVF